MTTTLSTDKCDRCDRETHHRIRIEMRTESQKEENAEFSREPYRIATCPECGAEHIDRMNNA